MNWCVIPHRHVKASVSLSNDWLHCSKDIFWPLRIDNISCCNKAAKLAGLADFFDSSNLSHSVSGFFNQFGAGKDLWAFLPKVKAWNMFIQQHGGCGSRHGPQHTACFVTQKYCMCLNFSACGGDCTATGFHPTCQGKDGLCRGVTGCGRVWPFTLKGRSWTNSRMDE